MHDKPFSLLQVQAEDETGTAYGAPLWLLVWGQQRQKLSPEELRQAYGECFNLEHFLGFAKAHLLFTHFQTFDTPRELNWMRLSGLAYAQLDFARSLVTVLPLLPDALPTPRTVQRGFGALIRQMGSLAPPPKPRGILPGRSRGTRLPPRLTYPRVKFHPSQKLCPCSKPLTAS